MMWIRMLYVIEDGNLTLLVWNRFVMLSNSWFVSCILHCCRAMSRQNNMFTCWTQPSQQPRGPFAVSLRTTRRKMVSKYQKFYNLSWVERLSCLSRPSQLLKPKGRNPRLSLVHLLNPQKPVAELVGNQIFFSGNKYETSPQIIV